MVLAADTIPAAPVLVFMGLGVLITIFGHASKSRTLIVTGLVILFMATAGMVIGAYVAYERGETDIREEHDPKDPRF
ncbi:MAG TPA: hypothetical protein VF529_01565 [Solirubrobacteraceae bacterium]|jgi:uncharacterized membrane protein (GlpM family)